MSVVVYNHVIVPATRTRFIHNNTHHKTLLTHEIVNEGKTSMDLDSCICSGLCPTGFCRNLSNAHTRLPFIQPLFFRKRNATLKTCFERSSSATTTTAAVISGGGFSHSFF